MTNRAPGTLLSRGAAFGRSRASARWAAALVALLAASGCEPPIEIVPTSYLAVVTLLDDTTTAAARRTHLTYKVRELSGTLATDTLLRVSAADTVFLPLTPATYAVSLDSLPATCTSRHGSDQLVVVATPPSTSLARYFVSCRQALQIEVTSEGPQQDPELVWRLEGPEPHVGLLGSSDTITFSRLARGDYRVALQHVATNCVVFSDGGATQSVTVPPEGGARAWFRVACSDPAKRPRLLHAAATHHDGAGALVFRAFDPDRDIERYWFDVTDCRGSSVLGGGPRLRRGLSGGRTAGRDTVTVVAAFETGLADSTLGGRCVALRVADEQGNTTPVAERALAPDAGGRPVASSFNALIVAAATLRVDVEAFDPDGDFAGYYVTALFRDGVFGPPDAKPDLGVYNSAGYLATPLPQIALGDRFQYFDVLSVTVYLVDARGRFSRVTDTDLFR